MIQFKKLSFSFLVNFFLFVMLMIGIQNSSQQKKVNLLVTKSIDLPVAFIIGTSFISGSIIGGILSIY
tara:strand:+ start:2143 stop:2346 length:204 start_codon:yes stop_codon:yes gene_type:complete